MKVGIDDYSFEDKNKWRVMMWSRIAGRIKKARHPANALGVYLCGPEDLDRPVAMRKGLLHHNLIAVDFNKKNVTAIRRTGALAIHGDLVKVVANWLYREPLAMIYGDFCSGLEEWVSSWMALAVRLSRFAPGCVVALNFQRGRDAWSNPLREALGYELKAQALEEEAKEYGFAEVVEQMAERRRSGLKFDLRTLTDTLTRFSHGVDLTKHRGAQFCARWWLDSLIAYENPEYRGGLEMEGSPNEKAIAELNLMRPEFLTYKGKRVVMDSVVFSLPFDVVGGEGARPLVPEPLGCERVARQIAACMAHRTMRRVA